MTNKNSGERKNYKTWQSELKYQIKDAIRYCGINPKRSGGWVDEITNPIVEDLFKRIETKVFPLMREKRLDLDKPKR